MALIPKYHLVAAIQLVDPNSLDILEGSWVAIGSAGARRATTGDQGRIYGISGDNKSSSMASMPGIYPGWQGRESDGYDETKASGKVTVYHSGGEFATDQFNTGNGALDSTAIGKFLKVDESTGQLILDGATKTANSVAQLTLSAGAYPSGVPGTDINGDMALLGANSNTYIEFRLLAQ